MRSAIGRDLSQDSLGGGVRSGSAGPGNASSVGQRGGSVGRGGPHRIRSRMASRGPRAPSSWSMVNTIAAAVDKAPAAVSQHLAKLRLARIVATRHDGTRVFYRLANEHAAQLVTDAIHQAEHALGQPRHHRTTTTEPT